MWMPFFTWSIWLFKYSTKSSVLRETSGGICMEIMQSFKKWHSTIYIKSSFFVYLLNQMSLRVDTSSFGDEDFACHHRGWIKMLHRLPWWLSRRVGWRRWSKSLGISIGCIVILRSRFISGIDRKDFLLSYAWLTCHSHEAALVLLDHCCF